MSDARSDRYGRLGAMIALLEADKRYKVKESYRPGPAQGKDADTEVTVFGPVTPDDIERRLPAPADLNFRRWSDDFVVIADPDDDPAVRPYMTVVLKFYPPVRWWQLASPSEFAIDRWEEPVVTPGKGLPE